MAKINTMQLENALRGLKYPITKDELIAHAEEQGLDEPIRTAMNQLPNHHFRSAGEITKAIGALSSSSRANS